MALAPAPTESHGRNPAPLQPVPTRHRCSVQFRGGPRAPAIHNNELVAQMHPRMPVIIPERHHAAWLGEVGDGNLKALLVPYPADQMRMWEMSPRVNSPKNDDSSLWEPLHEEPAQTTTDAVDFS